MPASGRAAFRVARLCASPGRRRLTCTVAPPLARSFLLTTPTRTPAASTTGRPSMAGGPASMRCTSTRLASGRARIRLVCGGRRPDAAAQPGERGARVGRGIQHRSAARSAAAYTASPPLLPADILAATVQPQNPVGSARFVGPASRLPGAGSWPRADGSNRAARRPAAGQCAGSGRGAGGKQQRQRRQPCSTPHPPGWPATPQPRTHQIGRSQSAWRSAGAQPPGAAAAPAARKEAAASELEPRARRRRERERRRGSGVRTARNLDSLTVV